MPQEPTSAPSELPLTLRWRQTAAAMLVDTKGVGTVGDDEIMIRRKVFAQLGVAGMSVHRSRCEDLAAKL